jgi:hypothetical protein
MARDPVLRVVLSIALGLAFLFGNAGLSQAKEYEVDGIVDCGRRSGQRCDFDGVLYLRTEHVTGTTERIKIDIKWMEDELPKLDQDDRIILLVEDVPRGGIRALSVSKVHEVDGTFNPGLTTGSRRYPEQPKPKQEDAPDNTFRPGSPTPTPSGSPTATPTTTTPTNPDEFSISGGCENTPGGANCNLTVTGLFGGRVGGIAQIRISTKASSAAPAVNETRSCSPISGSLSTSCNFTTSGLVYEGGPAQITYELASGGFATTPEVFGQCVTPRNPGEVC